MVYYPFDIVEKKSESWTRSEELQGLRVVRREGAFFTIPTVFALEGSIEKKNCLKMEWELLLFLYGTKSTKNYEPNGQPAQCISPRWSYKNRYIQRYWLATNWILRLFLWRDFTVCHWSHFCLPAVNNLNFYRTRPIKLAKIWKPFLLLFRIAR